MADELNLGVNIDTGSSAADVDAAAEAVRGLGVDLDELRSAAEDAATGIGDATADIGSDAEDAASAAAAIDDVSFDDLIGAAAALADELARMRDSAADSVGAVGDVGDAAGDLGGDLDGAGEAAGGADAAIAGMTGKAVTSLPGVGEALGPMTRGLQQVVKGAVSGKENLGKMAATAGAMVLVSIALKGIADNAAAVAEVNAWKKDQIDGFTESLKKGENQVQALTDRLRESGEIEFAWLDSKKLDIAPIMAQNGITVDQFSQAVIGGKPAIDAWGDALQQAGVDGNQVQIIQAAAAQQAHFYAKAQDTAAAFTKVFGDAAGDAAKRVAEHKLVTEQAKQSAENLGDQLDAETDAYKNLTAEIGKALAAQQKLLNANRAAADANFAVQDAADNYADTLDGLTQQIADAEGNQRKIAAAYRDATSSASALAQAQVDLKLKQAEANGETLSAAQQQDIFNRSMITSAATATGPLRDSILGYIADANGIPTSIATKISAAIEAGDIETANRLLTEASKDRDTAVQVDVDQAALDRAERKLDDLERERIVKFGVSLGNGVKAFAGGTSYAPRGKKLVGEFGPEIVDDGGGYSITPADQTARTLGAGGGTYVDASTTIINLPPAVSPETLAAAQRTTDRRRL